MKKKFDFENTQKARLFAEDLNNSVEDIESRWAKLSKGYRAYMWRKELKALVEGKDLTIEGVRDYMGLTCSETPSFWTKLPRKREVFIGIGMYLKQPLEVINKWIVRYGGKNRLYAKDVMSDLVWIYLINANYNDRDSNENYYMKYDECRGPLSS